MLGLSPEIAPPSKYSPTWELFQRVLSGGLDPWAVGSANSGRPIFASKFPQTPLKQAFPHNWGQKWGAPNLQIQRPTDPTPHLKPSDMRIIPGRNYIHPPPPPISGPKGIFQGRGVGVYILRPHAVGILYAPPPLYTPPTPRRVFSGVGGWGCLKFGPVIIYVQTSVVAKLLQKSSLHDEC